MKSRPVIIAMSILAGAQVLTGGAALADVIGKEAAGLLILVVAAAQVGVQFFVQNSVVPVKDTLAFRDVKGEVVAGPAAAQPEGQRVEVVSAADTPGL